MKTLEEAEEFFYVGTSYTQHSHGVLRDSHSRNCTPEMNGLMELLRDTTKRARALEFELESERRGYELKTAAILEGERRQFHHEVLCLVIEHRLEADPTSPKENVQLARDYAALAYPQPPKAEP